MSEIFYVGIYFCYVFVMKYIFQTNHFLKWSLESRDLDTNQMDGIEVAWKQKEYSVKISQFDSQAQQLTRIQTETITLLHWRLSSYVNIVMSNLEQILFYLKKMGCTCSRQTIRIDGVNYVILEHLADGYALQ